MWMPTQMEWMTAAQCVQQEEKERIGKFVFKKDAKSAMVGRLLIRRVVSFMLGIPYRCVKLARTERGKPYLLSPTDGKTPRLGCNFNISHQGDYVVIAAEADRLVGVDIMKVEWPRNTPVQDFFRTMDRQLTVQEWATVRKGAGDMDQLKAFYRFWCLKESFVKALGTGIGFEVARLNFNTVSDNLVADHITRSTTLRVDGAPVSNWLFEETMLEDHCVAVASRPETSEEAEMPSTKSGDEPWSAEGQFTVWSVQELLSDCQPLLGSQPDKAYWDNFSAKEEEPQGNKS
ncbi:hypothetical protein BaRGS_00018909 [Batillaria attramentaria]|uniref:L-aminoadipate-semialdehyde dehydrogenase-phosphopantetheinyl transferase n=1 Tax=Batillaria attramentaria TaxID=370345 RepID=A0ABD0KRI1_9CAEN